MTAQDISRFRIVAQKIIGTPFTNPKDLVAYMGAMQAQDYAMAKWALGTRLQNATDEIVTRALDEGHIIRTHVMRPTWHFVSPADIYWMLELTAPQIRTLSNSRYNQLGLTPALIRKCNRLFEKAMKNGNACTREELVAIISKAGIPLDDNRAAHILMYAELDEVICSGPYHKNKPTYTLLAHRVPHVQRFSREESMAMLAERYITSHGPASAHDFSWWSGLSVTDSKRAFEMVKSKFTVENFEGTTLMYKPVDADQVIKNTFALLPSYDEFLIAYRDRSAAISKEHIDHTISINGIFKPLIIVNAQVAGIWRRTATAKQVVVETEFFKPPSKATLKRLKQALKAYQKFLQLPMISH